MTATAYEPSWIELEGAVNVRDLGGLPTADGRRTATHRLLRSDNLQALSPADVRRLVDEIGLRTVVDLRTSIEVESEGPGALVAEANIAIHHHSVIPEAGWMTDVAADTDEADGHESNDEPAPDALLSRRDRAMERYPDDPVVAYYLGYLEDRPDAVVGALRSIAHSPGAALVNCAAGKDRTGVLVALALTLVDVDHDAVVADYAASGDRIVAILGRLRQSVTYSKDLDALPPDVHKPRAETMDAWLRVLKTRYGGADSWATEAGLTQADITALRAHLLD